MEAVGAIANVVGVASAALRLGNQLIEAYETLVEARTEISERIVEVRSQWYRIVLQLDYLQSIWIDLSESHRSVQEDIMSVLVFKLERAITKLNGLLKKQRTGESEPSQQEKPVVKRWKYLLLKSHLDEAIKDLEKWQKMYDPSWYLILRIASTVVDAELKKKSMAIGTSGDTVLTAATMVRGALKNNLAKKPHIELASSALNDARFEHILHCPAQYVQRAGATDWLIVDSVPCLSGSDPSVMETDIRHLVTKLFFADPETFGVLRCRRMIKTFNPDGTRLRSIEMVFATPSSGAPRSLRTCLVSNIDHTLTERLDLAKQMARSVNYVHTLDFVHKNVYPENFLGFGGTDCKLGSFYLLGFQQIRSADGITCLSGDNAWERNLYRHPERQGPFPEESYRMQHDIYSLGVCLLEIGLWRSLVAYADDGTVECPGPSLGLTLDQLRRKRPSALKSHLVTLARRELARTMGEIYEEVVVNCLTCLDDDNPDFGDGSEFDDPDGVSVGVRYIEKILLRLNDILV